MGIYNPTLSSAKLNVTTQTTTYNATVSDNLILCSGSAFTVTLPAASNTGIQLIIQKTDSSLTNIITVSGTGVSTTLNTQNESVTVVPDGSNWHILDRYSLTNSSSSLTFTPAGGFGTVSTSSFFSKRIGDSLIVWGTFTIGTASGTAASITLPTGIAIANLPSTATGTILGDWVTSAGTTLNMFTTPNSGVVFYDGSTSGSVFFTGMSGTTGLIKGGGTTVSGTGLLMTVEFMFPVSGWS